MRQGPEGQPDTPRFPAGCFLRHQSSNPSIDQFKKNEITIIRKKNTNDDGICAFQGEIPKKPSKILFHPPIKGVFPTGRRWVPMICQDQPRPFTNPGNPWKSDYFLNHFGFSSRHCFRCFSKALLDQQFHFAPFFPIGFMYGMFTYTFSIYNENQPNVGKHTIHGSYANFNCRLSLTFLAVQLAAYASSMRDQLLRDFHGEKNFHCRRIHGMVNLPRHLPYAIKSKQMYMGQNATHGTQCVFNTFTYHTVSHHPVSHISYLSY